MRDKRLLPALLVAAALTGSLLIPAGAASASTIVFETYRVRTVDGAEIALEVMRDSRHQNAPVILTYSPYNTIYETRQGNLANDSLGKRYVPQGYARAVADVLGTRNSSGCWDYGGPKEQQSGVDLVRFLANRDWSNGKVGMIGGSYDGTTANMVAARGAEAKGLAAIVPEAAISRWYGYAYSAGVRYLGNSEEPTDEGFDTPLAFDFGLVRTPPTDTDDPAFIDKLIGRANPCDSVRHTEEGYNRSPDYGKFWLQRDYRKDANRFRVPVLIAHGWQDYNVKQEEGVSLYTEIPVDKPGTSAVEGVPYKRLYMFQGPHSGPLGPQWQPLLDRFFDNTLKGINNGIRAEEPVITEGRTITDGYGSTGFKSEASWPPPRTRGTRLWLRREFDYDVPGTPEVPPGTGETGRLTARPGKDGAWTWVDTGTSTEEVSLRDPLNEAGHGYYSLYYKSPALTRNVRLAGSAAVDTWIRVQSSGSHLTPLLVDVAPDGTLRLVERGFLNLDYRNGLRQADPIEPGKWSHARVTLLPQDFTFRKGHRIGLIMQSSNTVWAVPGAAGTVNISNGGVENGPDQGSYLQLPLVGSTNGLFSSEQ